MVSVPPSDGPKTVHELRLPLHFIEGNPYISVGLFWTREAAEKFANTHAKDSLPLILRRTVRS